MGFNSSEENVDLLLNLFDTELKNFLFLIPQLLNHFFFLGIH